MPMADIRFQKFEKSNHSNAQRALHTTQAISECDAKRAMRVREAKTRVMTSEI